MKKQLLTVLMIAIGAATMASQNANELRVGVRAAWDYTAPATDLVGLDSGSGVSAGVFCDVPLAHALFFEPGVSFFYDTMDMDLLDVYFDNHKVGLNGTVRNCGFRVPFLLGYRFDLVDDISLSVVTGPQLDFGLSCKMQGDGSHGPDTNLYEMGWHRWDAGWTFGIKMHYQDSFIAEILGTVGVTDMLDSGSYPDAHLRRNLVNVGVGYIF